MADVPISGKTRYSLNISPGFSYKHCDLSYKSRNFRYKLTFLVIKKEKLQRDRVILYFLLKKNPAFVAFVIAIVRSAITLVAFATPKVSFQVTLVAFATPKVGFQVTLVTFATPKVSFQVTLVAFATPKVSFQVTLVAFVTPIVSSAVARRPQSSSLRLCVSRVQVLNKEKLEALGRVLFRISSIDDLFIWLDEQESN